MLSKSIFIYNYNDLAEDPVEIHIDSFDKKASFFFGAKSAFEPGDTISHFNFWLGFVGRYEDMSDSCTF